MAIRPDVDPKGSSPLSGASKSELEQYGVWVKAEPQDIVEESFLSEDEEKLLGSFDSEFDSEESGPLPDIEDMPALEEFESPGSPSTIRPDAEIDMSSIEGLDSRESSEKPSSSVTEDVSSEFLGSIDESEASSLSAPSRPSSEASDFVSGMDDVTAEFLDIEDSIASPKAAAEGSSEFESLDIDLHFDDAGASTDSTKAARSAGENSSFEPVTEFDDFLAVDTSSPASREPGFDDLSAVERDLASPVSGRESPKADLSTEILLKIADELASIRGELVSLKSKIGEAIVAGEGSPKKSSEDALESQDDSSPTGGFFDEEEDETIALTGDELDNILNTADFTTEEPAESEEPFDMDADALSANIASSDDGDLLDESLLPESGDYSPPSMIEPAIEEIRIGEADSVEAVMEESDGLDLMAEDGVMPLTPAPDDTTYLESPDSSALVGGAPPYEKPLVEPDLSDFDLGSDETELRLEIDEELPLAFGDSSAEAQVEDMTLGIEAGSDYLPNLSVEEGVSDAEFIQSVPEIEESNFSEINLHEENGSSSEASDVEEIDVISDSDLANTPEISEEEEDLMLSAVEKPSSPPPKASSAPPKASSAPPSRADDDGDRLKSEIKSVLSYLDKLLDSLPEEKIEEFAKSKYFDTYKKLFEELGLV